MTRRSPLWASTTMSDYPTLDAKVFGANGEGQTVREVLALGCGRAYEQLRAL